MKLLDAHCHLDLMADPLRAAEETSEAGIFAISVTNAPSVFAHTKNLCEGRPLLRAALGLHPELAASHQHELPLFLEQLQLTSFVGEIGLDFSTTDDCVRSLQRRVFRSIVDACAVSGGKILTVHSRKAASAVLDEIGGSFPGVVILHWFSGSHRELQRAIDLGCYFSVNLSMLQSKRGQSLISQMPKERTLTETDGPFALVRGKRATPRDISHTVAGLANLWRCSESEACESVAETFLRAVRSRWTSSRA